MTDSQKSLLRHKGVDQVLEVLAFAAPKFELPGGRGKKIPGEIRFVTPHANFDVDGIGYKLFHNDEWFQFEGMSSTNGRDMTSIVSGFVY